MAEPVQNAYLRDWRVSKGFSQTELARRVGVTKGEISRLEGGSRRLTMEWLERIATALGVNMISLMTPPPNFVSLEDRRTSDEVNSAAQRFGISPSGSASLVIGITTDEMSETLRVGDACIVERLTGPPTSSGLYALVQENVTIIRRLQLLGGGKVRVSPDNRLYDPFEADLGDLNIAGRVRARISPL